MLHPRIRQGAFLAGYMNKQAFTTLETDPAEENTIASGATSGALKGAGLGAVGGAGVQAVKNTLEGEEHKLKDYLKAMLIGGGVGAAGGAGIGAIGAADAENAKQNDASGNIQDALINVNQDRRPVPKLMTEDQSLDQSSLVDLNNKNYYPGKKGIGQ